MGKTRAIGSPRRRITNSPSVATNLADAAHVHLHTHSGWPVQRGPSILAQCGVTSRLRNQKIDHGLNEQTISQLWGIHQKAKVAEVSGEQHLGLTKMGSPVNHCTRFDAQMLSHLGRQRDLATALCITLKCEISA
jgi:hypothetical protein